MVHGVTLKSFSEKTKTENEPSMAPVLFDDQYWKSLCSRYLPEVTSASLYDYISGMKGWISDLEDKIYDYRIYRKKEISDCRSVIKKNLLKLSESDPHNSEYTFILDRQNKLKDVLDISTYIQNVSVRLNSIKTKIDSLEQRLTDNAPNSEKYFDDYIIISSEPRMDLLVVSECISHQLKDAVSKVDRFVKDRSFTENTMSIISSWNRDYISSFQKFSDHIFWREQRLAVEKELISLFEREFEHGFRTRNCDEITVSEKITAELEVYKKQNDLVFENSGIVSHSRNIMKELMLFRKLYENLTSFVNSVKDIFFELVDYDDKRFLAGLISRFYEQHNQRFRWMLEDQFSSEYFSEVKFTDLCTFEITAQLMNTLDEEEYSELINSINENLVFQIDQILKTDIISSLIVLSSAKGGYGLELI